MEQSFFLGLAVQVAAVLGAAFGIYWGLRGIRKQIWIGIFTQYTMRYSEVFDGLPLPIRSPGLDKKLNMMDEDLKRDVLNVMRRYLNLCSEEMYLAENGYLEDGAWEIWQTGIRDSMRLPIFTEAWNALNSEYGFYPKFQDFINNLAPSPVT